MVPKHFFPFRKAKSPNETIKWSLESGKTFGSKQGSEIFAGQRLASQMQHVVVIFYKGFANLVIGLVRTGPAIRTFSVGLLSETRVMKYS